MHELCLVTGATGFVGRHLCRRLLDEGCTVVAPVRRQVEFPEFSGRRFEPILIGDISGDTDWENFLSGVDTVFHLAAIGNANGSAEEQMRALRRVNVDGTRKLAHAAALLGVRRFVHLSTIKVNGEQTTAGQLFSENSQPAPATPYGITKWEAEQALWKEVHGTRTEAVVLRPPLVYGPQANGNFPQLLKLVAKGIPLPFAGLKNERSFVYLENLLDAMVLCARHPAAAGKSYLVDDGKAVSTPELIRMIAMSMDKRPRLFYFPGFLMRFFATILGKSEQAGRLLGSLAIDGRKIRDELGFVPGSAMPEGVRQTVRWYVQREPGIADFAS